MGEELRSLDQARPGAGERGRSIDRPDPLRADRPNLRRAALDLGTRPCCVPPAGHPHDHVGSRGGELIPLRGAGFGSGDAEHVLAARDLDHLGHPVASDEWRIEPFQGEHSGAGRAFDGGTHILEPPLEIVTQGDGPVGDPGRLAQPRDVGEHVGEVRGVERDHLRERREAGGHGYDVVVGDRADLADRLGDDQVDVELAQRGLVELVQVAPLAGQASHLGVDLARRRSGGGFCGRRICQHQTPGQMLLASCLRRVVALVGDGDHLIAQTEGE